MRQRDKIRLKSWRIIADEKIIPYDTTVITPIVTHMRTHDPKIVTRTACYVKFALAALNTVVVNIAYNNTCCVVRRARTITARWGALGKLVRDTQ